ncbi:MAG: tetratricopeptide repeat protein [Verrucomicrobiota bacterium]|jgi:tetratricopeptide (TPR) repeat protein
MPDIKPLQLTPFACRKNWLLGLLLLAATIAAYQPAWRAGFIWDDDKYVTGNPLLTAPDGLRRIWFSLDSPSQYFPLTYTAFYLERALWGLHPVGYHCVNILLHASNALLAWRLLARLRVPGAWLAAALFALHPVQVESVAWITERKNLLMAFFFLLSLLSWTRFLDEKTRRPWVSYTLALVSYALALSAKTTACTLPAALLLVLWLQKMPVSWRRLGQIAPFVAMGLAMGLLTVWWERYHQGTQGKLFDIGPLERLLIASRAAWFYAGKLLWPENLTFSYPRWTISASAPQAYIWLLATAALGMAIWRVRRWTGRGLEVAALFFGATLSPVLGFIMLYTFVYSFVADHYQYLACLGPLALAAAGIQWGFARRTWQTPALRLLFCAALLAALGALTWRQCGLYADAETLWRTTLARNPGCWMAYDNLGVTLFKKGHPEEALAQYRKAFEINPADKDLRNNMGAALFQTGQKEEAIAQYRQALELDPNNAEARNNLAVALFDKGAKEEAIAQYRKALQIKPDYAEARNNLGVALFDKGGKEEALAQYRRALEIDPQSAKADYNLGCALASEGQLDKAISHFRRAAKNQPGYANAYSSLGLVFFQKGETKEAIDAWQQALEIKPDQAIVQNNLAWLLATTPEASLRNGAKAVRLAEQASQSDGGSNEFLLHTLAAAYAESGRYGEAAATARRALELAAARTNDDLTAKLPKEIKLYEAGAPVRDVPQ